MPLLAGQKTLMNLVLDNNRLLEYRHQQASRRVDAKRGSGGLMEKPLSERLQATSNLFSEEVVDVLRSSGLEAHVQTSPRILDWQNGTGWADFTKNLSFPAPQKFADK